MIVFESCDCDCCRRAEKTIGELSGKRLVDIERAENSLNLAQDAVAERNRWRSIARQLFRQAIFSSPEARQRIVEACPGIEKQP